MRVKKIKQKPAVKTYVGKNRKAFVKISVEDYNPLTIEQEAKIKAFFESL